MRSHIRVPTQGRAEVRPSRTPRFSAVLVLVTTAAVMLAAAANAGPPFRETIHEEFEFVDDNFCDAGLTVEVAVVLDIRVHAVPHGRDRLVYFLQHGTETDVLTNLENSKSIRSFARVIEKDIRVTDNGDGTLTVLIQATGNATLYGENGKAIARNPGQIRIELLIDHGGTPNDPSDDEVLSEELVKGSTGRSDDFCEAAVPALS
jgi:hypothetical protein